MKVIHLIGIVLVLGSVAVTAGQIENIFMTSVERGWDGLVAL